MSDTGKVKEFYLFRKEDESGVSGTGEVAVGIEFPSGVCVMEWLVEPHTHGWYDSVKDVIDIHGHDGKTELIWIGK